MLTAAVLTSSGQAPDPQRIRWLNPLFAEEDRLVAAPVDALEGLRPDLAIVLGVVGSTPVAGPLAELRIPCMAVDPYLVFPPFHGAFYRQIEQGGGIVLPALDPGQIAQSLEALRAAQAVRGSKLVVVDAHEEDFRADEVAAFARGAAAWGVEVIRRPVAELDERAASYADAAAEAEIARWQADIVSDVEMDEAHMRQIARLCLAERAMLNETGACGITVEDIGAYYLVEPRKIMPNATYGILAHDGFLACEEGDVEVLASELLLWRGLGKHPSMSNLYLAYRDAYDGLASYKDYTHEQHQADYRQCLADNRVTISHFSACGVLSPDMMEEDRYRLREALPGWPGQSMVCGTPRLGPVVMARLSADAGGLHWVPGEADRRTVGEAERFGWYRCRYFVRLPDMVDFIGRCQHHHYAIGPENGRREVLRTLVERVLGLRAL